MVDENPEMSEAFLQAVVAGDLARLSSSIEADPGVMRSVLPASRSPSGIGGCSALHLAVHLGDRRVAELLVDAGIDLDLRSEEGRTALHDSIEHGHVEIERLLLGRGAEVDLCAASILGRIGEVRAFLDADPEVVNDRSTRLSPLGWAAFGNRAEVARELIARGARMDDGELLCAASVGHVEVGRVLLEHGADPNAPNPHGSGNALHAAASMTYTDDASDFVALLLEAGVDPSLRTSQGWTALKIAEEGARRQEQGEVDRARDYEAVIRLLRVADGTTGGTTGGKAT